MHLLIRAETFAYQRALLTALCAEKVTMRLPRAFFLIAVSWMVVAISHACKQSEAGEGADTSSYVVKASLTPRPGYTIQETIGECAIIFRECLFETGNDRRKIASRWDTCLKKSVTGGRTAELAKNEEWGACSVNLPDGRNLEGLEHCKVPELKTCVTNGGGKACFDGAKGRCKKAAFFIKNFPPEQKFEGKTGFEWCTFRFQKMAQAQAKCCTGRNHTYEAYRWEDQCIRDDFRNPDMEFDLALFKASIASIETFAQACESSANLFKTLPEKGKLRAGQKCSEYPTSHWNRGCDENSVCVQAFGQAEGVCKALPLAGAACSELNMCAKGSFCSSDSDTKCIPALPNGAPCGKHYGVECTSGYCLLAEENPLDPEEIPAGVCSPGPAQTLDNACQLF